MSIHRIWAFLFAAASLLGQPIAISTGRIAGKDMGEVQAWLGIPYAAPPVGSFRWAPPQPPASWEGVRAMDRYGNWAK